MSHQSKLSSFYSVSESKRSSSDIGTDIQSTITTSSSSISSTSASSHSKSSTIPLPECPVNPLDPADVTGHLLSLPREYKRHLVQLGPCQPRSTSYPSHQRNDEQRRSFLREHVATQYHMSSMVAFKSYLQNKPINCLLDQQRAEEQSSRQREIANNWQVLSHLLDIIKLLAKQNLAVRGHNESADSLNRGNFLELVHHQAKYDPILQQHLQKSGKNATYLSPDIQNQLICAMADKVLENILMEVKEAFILRYVDSQCTVQERFIGLLQVAKTDSESLQQSVNEVLLKHDLQWRICMDKGMTELLP